MKPLGKVPLQMEQRSPRVFISPVVGPRLRWNLSNDVLQTFADFFSSKALKIRKWKRFTSSSCPYHCWIPVSIFCFDYSTSWTMFGSRTSHVFILRILMRGITILIQHWQVCISMKSIHERSQISTHWSFDKRLTSIEKRKQVKSSII